MNIPHKLSIIFIIIVTILGSGKTTETKHLDEILLKNSYIKLIPESNIYKAGSIVNRIKYNAEDTDPDSTSLGALCSDTYTVDKYPDKPVYSKSISSSYTNFNNGSIGFNLPILNKIVELSSDISGHLNTTFNLSNVEIKSFAQDDLLKIRKLMGSECIGYLNGNINSKNAFQIQETFSADMELTVDFSANISAEVKSKFIKTMENNGLKIGTNGKTVVIGTGLVYGFRWIQLVEKDKL